MAELKAFTFGRTYGDYTPGSTGKFDERRWKWLTDNDYDKPLPIIDKPKKVKHG